jgi:hypothetical protein
MGPEKTIDGPGLTGDLHGTEGTTMWLTTGVGPNWIQYQFDKVYKLLESKGQLSSGTDNLLQGIADKHEEFVYLLKQRCSSKVSYDRRPRG